MEGPRVVAGKGEEDEGGGDARRDPGFDNMVVSYFEDQVTWSVPLMVPPDAPPGPRTLKVQAAYQICDARSCLPAGRSR